MYAETTCQNDPLVMKISMLFYSNKNSYWTLYRDFFSGDYISDDHIFDENTSDGHISGKIIISSHQVTLRI